MAQQTRAREFVEEQVRAIAGDDDVLDRSRPMITTNKRNLDEVTDDVISALLAANDPPRLFLRSGTVVRVRIDEDDRPVIETMTPTLLRSEMARAAEFVRWTDKGITRHFAPLDVAADVLARTDLPFPPLLGITEVPVVRADGSVLVLPGYDKATRLFHITSTAIVVPECPTLDQVAKAVDLVNDMMADFPFDTIADRANAWALLLTHIVRPLSRSLAPLCLVDSPEPGTGKGLWVSVVSTLTSGRSAAVSDMPAQDEELRKRITSMLIRGAGIVNFDNVEGQVRSPVLAMALTADIWEDRVLGRSEMSAMPNQTVWTMTGNNVSLGGDLARRTYRIRLDAHQANPWQRTQFRHADLIGHVREHRGEILAALLTIVRAWVAADRPAAGGLPAMGGYTPWVRTIGGILANAGIVGFLENLKDFHAQADQEAGQWESFLSAWREERDDRIVTVGELIKWMEPSDSPMRETLPEDLAGKWGDKSFNVVLGKALKKRAGRHYGPTGLHVVEVPKDRRRVALFVVETRGSAHNPRADEASTSDDATPRGFAGVTPSAATSKSSEESQGQGRRVTPATPAPPRGEDLDPFGLFDTESDGRYPSIDEDF